MPRLIVPKHLRKPDFWIATRDDFLAGALDPHDEVYLGVLSAEPAFQIESLHEGGGQTIGHAAHTLPRRPCHEFHRHVTSHDLQRLSHRVLHNEACDLGRRSAGSPVATLSVERMCAPFSRELFERDYGQGQHEADASRTLIAPSDHHAIHGLYSLRGTTHEML